MLVWDENAKCWYERNRPILEQKQKELLEYRKGLKMNEDRWDADAYWDNLVEKDITDTNKKEQEPGGSTPSQYSLPAGAKELQDLIEFREMGFSLGNIFKACYRFGNCSHSDKLRDINKILWFANREKKRLEGRED